MDFPAVVQRAKELHVQGRPSNGDTCTAELEEDVYGRICTSHDSGPPQKLTSTVCRKTAFVFGPDAVLSVILKMNAYDALLELGFTRQYLHYELVEKKYTFWLLLFKLSACLTPNSQEPLLVPATWDGITGIVRSVYPKVHSDLTQHLDTLKETPFERFEEEAGFEFLQSIKNERESSPDVAPFYSYDKYCSLLVPRKAWQVRLFLYCEMRLLKLFRGDGCTVSASAKGSTGCLEYLCPNIRIADLDSRHSELIPMSVFIPSQGSDRE